MGINRLKRAVFLIILVPIFIAGAGIFSFSAQAAQDELYSATAEDLSGNKYFPKVLEALKNAKKSISMVMYFTTFGPQAKNSQVNQLVEELVNAHKRGVKVKVILDQNIDFSSWEGGAGEWEKEEKNDPLFVYLKKQGIEVYYDNIYTTTHTKAIVIDDEIVILGSANWTESSLRRNQEASCLVRSKGLAKEILADFSGIAIDYEASILDEERKPPVRLNQLFLTDPSLAGRMLSAHDENAFDLYLFLLRNFDGNPQGAIVIDYKTLIPALGLAQKLKFTSARQELKQALRRLDEKYRLITRKKKFFQKTTVILLNYPDKTPYSAPLGKYCSIPDEYWSYGWSISLNFPEKYCYLINLAKGGTRRGHLWSDYMVGLSQEFNIGRNGLWKGMSGLRKLDIIDVEYSDYSLEEGFIRKEPIRFKLLGLYFPQRLDKEKARLAKLYGAEQFQKAAAYAEIVYKGNDIQVIEDILEKIKQYGPDQVERAFKIVSEKSPGNQKRSYKYVIGILQSEAEK